MASVFSETDLQYYMNYDTPIIKIACRKPLYKLLDMIPIDKLVYLSIADPNDRHEVRKKWPRHRIIFMHCIAEYPANPNVYESVFWGNLSYSISDHTKGLELYKKHEPIYYEKHFIYMKKYKHTFRYIKEN